MHCQLQIKKCASNKKMFTPCLEDVEIINKTRKFKNYSKHLLNTCEGYQLLQNNFV